MSYKTPLRWQPADNPRCRCYQAIVSHGCYEVRSYKPKRWRAYRDGTLISRQFFISRQLAIAFVEDRYYVDDRQNMLTMNVRRKNAKLA